MKTISSLIMDAYILRNMKKLSGGYLFYFVFHIFSEFLRTAPAILEFLLECQYS